MFILHNVNIRLLCVYFTSSPLLDIADAEIAVVLLVHGHLERVTVATTLNDLPGFPMSF
ncbi:MAG: hypothetical protein P8L18_10760 [Verrucomicrobiota bacterium]|nr:hypothetical protein [Verrucomicrobiota bacterium]